MVNTTPFHGVGASSNLARSTTFDIKTTSFKVLSYFLFLKENKLYCGGGAMVARNPHKVETRFESSDRIHLLNLEKFILYNSVKSAHQRAESLPKSE